MSLLIKEFTGNGENFIKVQNMKLSLKEDSFIDVQNSESAIIQPNSIMVDIEAIHGFPHATRNFTRYMPIALKNSVPTWTSPYRRPMILFHNEQDGDIIGRIVAAEYVTKNTKSGTPALIFTVNIADEKAVEKVKSGILDTTSIGVMANTVKCSICGQDITEDGPCEHDRGQIYDVDGEKQVCYWDIYDMEGKECSYVIVPSDIYSGNIKIYKPSKTPIQSKESNNNKIGVKMNLKENTNKTDTEGKSSTNMTEEEIKKLQNDLKESQEKVSTLENEKAALQEKLTAAEGKTTELETSLSEEKEKNEATTKNLEEAQKSLESEKSLRESLEEQIHSEEKKKKQSLVETVIALRNSIGGKSEVKVEDLIERSVDSLNDSIKDLNEELRLKDTSGKTPQPVVDPTLHEENNNNSKTDKAVNVDVKESMNDIIKGVFGR